MATTEFFSFQVKLKFNNSIVWLRSCTNVILEVSQSIFTTKYYNLNINLMTG